MISTNSWSPEKYRPIEFDAISSRVTLRLPKVNRIRPDFTLLPERKCLYRTKPSSERDQEEIRSTSLGETGGGPDPVRGFLRIIHGKQCKGANSIPAKKKVREEKEES